jgi:hypothetical protein
MEKIGRLLSCCAGKHIHRALLGAATLALLAPSADLVAPAMSADPRTIQFSGYEWHVKNSASGKVGPGPNYFSDSLDNVWVDAAGQLHLRITRRGNRWYCAEVVSKLSLGHGTYRWYVGSPVGNFDENVVLGLFTWDNDPAYNNREIDIEFARWGNPRAQNAQYVVQPSGPANLRSWDIPAQLVTSTHTFKWLPDSVAFQSLSGLFDLPPAPSYVLQQWMATNGVPPAGAEHAEANLWLFLGRRPSANNSVEVVFKAFEFIPAN